MKICILIFFMILGSGCKRNVTPVSRVSADSIDGREGFSSSYARKTNALSKINEMNSVYQTVRDNDYYGSQHGVIAMADRLKDKGDELLQLWITVDHFIEGATKAELSTFVAETTIIEELAKSDHMIHELTSLNAQIYRKANAAHAKLGRIPKIESRLELFKNGRLEEMESFVGSLQSAFEEVRDKSLTYTETIQNASREIKRVMIGKLINAYQEKAISNLSEAKNRAETLLLSTRTVEPIFLQVLAKKKMFEQLVYVHGKIFVEEEYEALGRFCEGARAKISVLSTVSSEVKDKYKRKVSGLCTQARDLVTEPDYYAEALAEMVDEIRKPRVKAACKEATSSGYNCDMYSWVSGYATPQILKLSVTELKALERAWDRIESTPVIDWSNLETNP